MKDAICMKLMKLHKNIFLANETVATSNMSYCIRRDKLPHTYKNLEIVVSFNNRHSGVLAEFVLH